MDIHNASLNTLIRHILQPPAESAQLDRALDHVSSCTYCLRRLSEMAEALGKADIGTDQLPPACPEWRHQLVEYAAAHIEGHDATTLFPATARHVATCPDCQAALSALTLVRVSTTLPSYPNFAEAFALSSAQTGIASLVEVAKTHKGLGYTLWLADEVRRQAMTLVVRLGELLASGPSRQLAFAHRGETPTPERVVTSFRLDAHDWADLEAEVIIYEDPVDPSHCQAEVEVTIPSRWPDFSGIEVLMISPTGMKRAVTGRQGRATFPELPRQDIERTMFAITVSPDLPLSVATGLS